MHGGFEHLAFPSGDQGLIFDVSIDVPNRQVVGVDIWLSSDYDWTFLVVLVILTRGHWILNLAAVANATFDSLGVASSFDESVWGWERFTGSLMSNLGGLISICSTRFIFSLLGFDVFKHLESVSNGDILEGALDIGPPHSRRSLILRKPITISRIRCAITVESLHF